MTALVSRRSSYLFAKPSFWSGFGRGLDLFGRFDRYNTVNSDAESDSEAVANDWQAVGDDLWAAYEQVKPK
jgi:hypothetical protein